MPPHLFKSLTKRELEKDLNLFYVFCVQYSGVIDSGQYGSN